MSKSKRRKADDKKVTTGKTGTAITGSSNFEAMLSSGKIKKGTRRKRKVVPNRTTVEAQKKPRFDVVALDCEMYGTGAEGEISVLARATVVDYAGAVIYDEKCRPDVFITDFRSQYHGQSGKDLYDALPFKVVQQQVMNLLKDKICVGHDLRHDFQALEMVHPKRLIRDTAYYKPLRPPGQKRKPALRTLSKKVLGKTIQRGAHDSAEDAIAALELYKLHQQEWESSKKKNRARKTKKK